MAGITREWGLVLLFLATQRLSTGFVDLPGKMVTLEIGIDEIPRSVDKVPKGVLLSTGSILPGCASFREFDPDLREAGRKCESCPIRRSSAPILRADFICKHGYLGIDLSADGEDRFLRLLKRSDPVTELPPRNELLQPAVKDRIIRSK